MILRKRYSNSSQAHSQVYNCSLHLLLVAAALVLSCCCRHVHVQADSHLSKTLRNYDASTSRSRTIREQYLLARRPWLHQQKQQKQQPSQSRRPTTRIKATAAQQPPSNRRTHHSLLDAIKLGFCGGLGGAVGTLILFPMDSAKTLRQADPTKYPSVGHALWGLIHTTPTTPALNTAEAAMTTTATPSRTALSSSLPTASTSATTSATSTWHVGRAYRGLLSSTLGAIPSSALYFGTYASVKRTLQRKLRQQLQQQERQRRAKTNHHTTRAVSTSVELQFPQRFVVHALAAASGNLVSSAIFVPKEVLKQKMQYSGLSLGATLASLWTTPTSGGSGGAEPAMQFVASLYRGWQTTLLRNVPSAILRFCIYEELKRAMIVSATTSSSSSRNRRGCNHQALAPAATAIPVRIFLAGAAAGALASGLMTPVDVLKTRVSTGTCPVDLPACVNLVVSEHGWKGLYAGAGSRMAFSGAFSAIGFGTYEMAKVWLNVSDDDAADEDD